MSKILKNNTASPVIIDDVGQTVPASSQLTIQPQDYLLYAASNDVITLVGDSTLTVNDGSFDLSISDGTKLIQGIFPNPVGLSDENGTQIDGDLKQDGITNAIHVISEVDNAVDNPVPVVQTRSLSISLSDILNAVTTSGLFADEVFDELLFGKINDDQYLLTYNLNTIAQFQIEIQINSEFNWSILKRPAEFFLLQENGDFLLQENGDKLIAQGLIP